MWVKKFLARTLPEAMAQVKAELGSEAVILHTNQVKVGGIFGLFGTKMIEVTAAAEHTDRWKSESLSRSAPVLAPAPASMGQPVQRHLPESAFVASPVASPVATTAATLQPPPVAPLVEERKAPIPPVAPPDNIEDVKNDVSSMKALLHQVLDSLAAAEDEAQMPPVLMELFENLVEHGVQEDLATGLIERIRQKVAGAEIGQAEVVQIARKLIQGDLGKACTLALPVSGRRVVALVGPTGVGKTTTVAKLAAHYALGRRLRVGLITSDTFRVAAVDQLRTYSEILGVPLEVIYDPGEILAAVERQRNRDLILVDTAGRSPRNDEHMQELQEYLRVLRPDETYLVMSMTSGYRDARRIVDCYLPLGFDRFIFTKWDEAAEPGLIYSIVCKYKLPLSYITTGQNVPDDIETANPDIITRAILGD